MIEEYNIVKASRDLSARVLKGYLGIVLIVYPDFPNSYEVEFVDKDMNTLEVLTVNAEDINKADH